MKVSSPVKIVVSLLVMAALVATRVSFDSVSEVIVKVFLCANLHLAHSLTNKSLEFYTLPFLRLLSILKVVASKVRGSCSLSVSLVALFPDLVMAVVSPLALLEK
jgi:hypothetical protein